MKKLLPFLLTFIIFLIIPSKVSAQVVINEFLPNPSSGDDWVELYSESDVDIGGWILDDSGTSTNMATIPASTFIGPSTSKFYAVDVGSRLNQSEDTITLYLPDGTTSISSQGYSYNPGVDISIGRFPDGQTWGTCTPTKNSSNLICTFPTPSPSPTPVVTQAPTSNPTNAPTASPTPTKTSTPVPTKSPTPKPTKSPTSEPEVLGEESTPEPVTPTPTPLVLDSVKKKFPFLPIIFIGSGVLMIGFAVYNLVRAKKNPVQV